MPSRWAALRGRYYVHLVQMHGPFPNLVRVGVPLFARLSCRAGARVGAQEPEVAKEAPRRRGAGIALVPLGPPVLKGK